MYKAIRIFFIGLVQGVGFRPTINRVAKITGVKGYVRNLGGSEVEIFIEGSQESIDEFFRELSRQLPPYSLIEEITIINDEPRGLQSFEIMKSSRELVNRSMIPPDIAICDECLKEVLNPSDRRYRYPFNSCAWCGPRYSMIYSLPYDRENTSMKKYKLCRKCLDEYNNIYDVRRHHAQGISCPEDGPRLALYTSDRKQIDSSDPLKDAAKLIDDGYIVAVKGIGGFHIAALATDDDVVLMLRKRKNRPTKPFAIMCLNLDIVSRLVYFAPPSSIDLLTSPQRPIVLLPKRHDSPVSRYVSPNMDVEGVFLPYTALHYLLLMETRDKFLIMTSGNIHGEPMCIDDECVFTKLRGVVDYVLTHDREIVNRVDDSVVRYTDGIQVILRRGRGYAPKWIRLPIDLKQDVLAFGAELQTSGAIGFNDKVVLMPYIGDLDNVDTLRDFEKTLWFFVNNYSIDLSKTLLVIDKHPLYASREIAYEIKKKYGSNILEVQHHYAHILSTLADRGIDLDENVVGIAIDGVGYGDDGNIWGGEVILVQGRKGYRRCGHLEYIPITSDRDSIYPARISSAILISMLGSEAYNIIKKFGLIEKLPYGENELTTIFSKIVMGDYIRCSSIGRYLDAVSALLGFVTHRSYEGEPAIIMEAMAKDYGKIRDFEPIEIKQENGITIIKTLNYFIKLLEYLDNNDPRRRQEIALKIQLELGKALAKTAINELKGRKNTKQIIVLGGGAAVNNYIIRGIREIATNEDVKVILPRKIPPNDGGIALGQVYATITMNT